MIVSLAVGIAVLAMVNFSYKAAGPAVLGDLQPPPRVQELIMSMSPALLAGLVVVDLAGPHWRTFDPTLLPGLAAAGVAYLVRVPDLACIALAVAVTIGVRLVAG